MESRNLNGFAKVEYLRSFISDFLQSQYKTKQKIVSNLNSLNRTPSTSLAQSEKKQILERLDKLFAEPKFVKLVQAEKQKRRNNRFQ